MQQLHPVEGIALFAYGHQGSVGGQNDRLVSKTVFGLSSAANGLRLGVDW